ncbi:molybdopterin-dependent oxidoreductase [Providencia rettgeri]|nr:molybdopterin-dependent oxidoreductase [Providencia rettgeri]
MVEALPGRVIFTVNSGFGAAWAAWVCDLTVNRRTGQVLIKKVYVAHDCGQIVNPDGVKHQVHGNIIQSCSRVLKEFATFDKSGTTSLEWGDTLFYVSMSYPKLTFN